MYFRVSASDALSGHNVYRKSCSRVVRNLEGCVEYTTDYFWVVVCKNRRVHHKGNTGYEHKILLGETDAFTALPMLSVPEILSP